MAWTSYDDMISEVWGNSKKITFYFQKTLSSNTPSTAGFTHECFTGAGTGGTGVLNSAGDTSWRMYPMTSATTGALPLNDAVSPDTRYLMNIQLMTPQTTVVPCNILLTDLLAYYPKCVLGDVSPNPTAFDNTTNSFPVRYGTGEGVQVSVFTTSDSAASPAVDVTYTDDASVTGKVSRLFGTGSVTSVGQCLTGAQTSPSAGTKGGPLGFLANGSYGIQKLTNYGTAIASTSGVGAFVLHRPICSIQLNTANVAVERDFITQIPLAPRIDDSACLAFLVTVGGAAVQLAQIYGQYTIGWG